MGSKRYGRRCSRRTAWGRCSQRTEHPSRLCSSHYRWSLQPDKPVDPYYERKIVEGLLEPTWDWMDRHESHALLNGRYRGDGRRIDLWVTADPLSVELE